MDIKTFRAKTMQEALNLVRQEMGMEATVLHTRELNTGLLRRMFLGKQYEIAATQEMAAPIRAPEPVAHQIQESFVEQSSSYESPVTLELGNGNFDFQEDAHSELDDLNAIASQLQQRSTQSPKPHLTDALFQAYTDMIESDIDQDIAQELLDALQSNPQVDMSNQFSMQTELATLLQQEFSCSGAISTSAGQGRVVALVGPTGVGKTTTIAKLAANFRLRENKRVGLITVDTYRIAAVEQLRTYADIIDLPMEVVSTPREMREAVSRMSDLDLVLMDTAGRSPRDEVKIQELRSMLSEAEPDEVHLVLSAVAGSRSLISTAEKFATVGTTSMLITKLDEATCLGNLLGLTRACGLPISYLTDGQNVPDDIQVARPQDLAHSILGTV